MSWTPPDKVQNGAAHDNARTPATEPGARRQSTPSQHRERRVNEVTTAKVMRDLAGKQTPPPPGYGDKEKGSAKIRGALSLTDPG